MTGKEFAKGSTDLVMQVSEYFNSIGNKVESKYGTFILNRTGVKSSISAPIHLGDEDYYFADILPQSVLKHYGYSSRPEGNIGESALFSMPSMQNLSVKTSTLRKSMRS